jgi:hypothetical protein
MIAVKGDVMDCVEFKGEKYPVDYKLSEGYTHATVWINGRKITKSSRGLDEKGALQGMKNQLNAEENFRL